MPGIEPAKKVRGASANDIDERSLVEVAQRDSSRFAEIYQRYFELVYAYVVRRVRDRAATEDLTSEVFRKALANLRRFKWTGAPFGAWLLRIASNVIADRAKKAAREPGTSPSVGAGSYEPSQTVGLLPGGAANSSES